MPDVHLSGEVDFEGWRSAARRLCAAEVRPHDVRWTIGQERPGFEEAPAPTSGPERAGVAAPREFVALAEAVICHRHPERFALLYRLLYRLRGCPELLQVFTDPDVSEAGSMARQVDQACHRMRAFLRFRRLHGPEGGAYVAWFEPPHRVLERAAPFFVRRFASRRFSILTPDACAHWDGACLALTPGADCGPTPGADDLEAIWRTCWRNPPAVAVIPPLIAAPLIVGAGERRKAMVRVEPTVSSKRRPQIAPGVHGVLSEGPVPGSLPELAQMIQTCRRCDLWRNATQGVAGEGPRTARLMLVGEKPGDQEDLAGVPFVGPAGLVLNRALEQAGVPRAETYVTNAVKHFKYEQRGKRRLHKTPDTSEVVACRWWLGHERRLVRPRLILAMGATAALSVIGKATPIGKSRGEVFQLDDQAQAMVTVHPSYLLRIPDRAAKAEAFGRFVEDLALAWERAAA